MLREEQIRWSLMKNVFFVLTLLKVMVCFRCSLQLMHFFVHLKHPSVSLSCSGSCGFCVEVLNGISFFLRLLQFRSPTIGGDGAAFLILELERRTGMYFLSHFGVCDGRDFSDRRVSNYEGILFSSVFFFFFFFFLLFFFFSFFLFFFSPALGISFQMYCYQSRSVWYGDTGCSGCFWYNDGGGRM